MAKQLMRYLCVGAGSNAVVLCLYYMATLVWNLYPGTALTIASGIGFFISYTLQRAWAFRFSGNKFSSLLRYSFGYFLSYTAQWLILFVGVDKLLLPHQWVFLFGLATATLGFFALQRYWVFKAVGRSPSNAHI
ncbi:GtrA family protein [Microvirga calopogonii]|uniref:GtrA family protein n=1 Tax=Microvirga calopogonii TaxID=2078013 RepID=UPI000E0D6906|nr:GtrA family protein [Microvirga calopogonii]